MSHSIPLPDAAATRQLGAALARRIGPGDVVALRGNLGAGKTTLVRGLVEALCGPDSEVVSPTFTLVQSYDADGLALYHYDLFRLDTPDELTELGWEDTSEGVLLVEWPERAGARLPPWRLEVTLAKDGDGRSAALVGFGEDWQNRIDGFRI
jgi:tRNA threonylcarbamoyladenosine biosynthesis protein TsaE